MFVRVRVFPGMKKERVTKRAIDTYELVVREPAERNLANARVRSIIAEAFGVPVGKVRIVAGHRSLSKILEVMLPS